MNQSELNTFALTLQQQIYQLVKNYELCDKVCLTQHSVTSSQGYSLLSLPQEGSLTMNEMSETMGIACSTMTRIVDPLVDKKLVRRDPDAEDRRIVRVSLTEQGRELRLTLEKELQDLFKYVLSEIKEDEFQNITSCMEKVNNAFTKACKDCCSI
ncbi:MAG: winged helix-turn-helix transcriptional regulator [Ruminiclostridium sp.]|nr:winged helix-turn-helix transcriptional regulator [Ruminiclostridium sp.]